MHKSAPIRFGSIAAHPPLALDGQRIGLLGGSFNPPHPGHRLISQIALKRLGLDQVWWIVTPRNPLKSRTVLAPLDHRLRLCAAISQDRRIRVTAFEQDLRTTFTVGTLTFLKARYSGVRFVWLMGADCLAEFHRWQHWREIFSIMPIAVVDRPGQHLAALSSRSGRAFQSRRFPENTARLLPMQVPPAWLFLTGPLSPISSTALRRPVIETTGTPVE